MEERQGQEARRGPCLKPFSLYLSLVLPASMPRVQTSLPVTSFSPVYIPVFDLDSSNYFGGSILFKAISISLILRTVIGAGRYYSVAWQMAKNGTGPYRYMRRLQAMADWTRFGGIVVLSPMPSFRVL